MRKKECLDDYLKNEKKDEIEQLVKYCLKNAFKEGKGKKNEL